MRVRVLLGIAGALIAAAVCAGVFRTVSSTATLADDVSAAAPGFLANLSDLRLVDQDGRPFRPAALQGKVVLLNFVFTGCAATCPTQTRELAALQQTLPAPLQRDVRFVSVSVDPLGDTPALLRAYGTSAGADFSSWTFATGRTQDIEALGERLRLFRNGVASGSPADHTTALWLIDGHGRLMQRYVGTGIDRPRLLRDMEQVRDLAVPSG